MPGAGGMLKLRFDWYITSITFHFKKHYLLRNKLQFGIGRGLGPGLRGIFLIVFNTNPKWTTSKCGFISV